MNISDGTRKSVRAIQESCRSWKTLNDSEILLKSAIGGAEFTVYGVTRTLNYPRGKMLKLMRVCNFSERQRRKQYVGFAQLRHSNVTIITSLASIYQKTFDFCDFDRREKTVSLMNRK